MSNNSTNSKSEISIKILRNRAASNDNDADSITSHTSVHSSNSDSQESIVETTDNEANIDEDPMTATSSKQIEEELFKAVHESSKAGLAEIFLKYRSSSVLQVLLTFSYPNRPVLEPATSKSNVASRTSVDSSNIGGSNKLSSTQKSRQHLLGSMKGLQATKPYYTFDPDIQQEAQELLGSSVSPLNLIQIACINGEEEIACDILQYIYKHTHTKQKLLLMEFLGKTWGDSNTTLHLASFQGMNELIKDMLKAGANILKKNGRGYRPVDCADENSTRGLFRTAMESVRTLPKTVEEGLKRNASLLKGKVGLERNSSLLRTGLSANTGTNGLSPNKKALSSNDLLSRPITAPVQSLSIAERSMSSSLEEKEISESIRATEDHAPKSASPTRIDSKSYLSLSKSSLIRRDTAPPVSSTNTARKKVPLRWEPNCLFLDFAKNGELQKMKDLVADFASPMIPLILSSNYGPDSSTLNYNYSASHTGLTALHSACAYGHKDVIKYLVEELQVDVNVQDSEGWAPIHSLIAEIPEAEPAKPTPATAHTEEEKKTRIRYLDILNYYIQLKNVKLDLLTNEGDTVVDVVKENDDTGELDSAVLEIIENELKKRGIDIDEVKLRGPEFTMIDIDSEEEESVDDSPVEPNVPQRNISKGSPISLPVKISESIEESSKDNASKNSPALTTLVNDNTNLNVSSPEHRKSNPFPLSQALASRLRESISAGKDGNGSQPGTPVLNRQPVSVAATLERLRKARLSDPEPYKVGSNPSISQNIPKISAIIEKPSPESQPNPTQVRTLENPVSK